MASRQQIPVAFRAILAIAIVTLSAKKSSGDVIVRASLGTSSLPTVYDNQLRRILDNFIATANSHSVLLVLTECYGGDMLDNFTGRTNTTVLSATSPGQTAIYGGYDNDAASALRAGAGRTSDTVHNLGVIGAAYGESPQQQGPLLSLEPTNPGGPIKNRRVLIYAGHIGSGNGTGDIAQRDQIINNFATDAATTVTTVGGPGGGGWDFPGTLSGLKTALQGIGATMNVNTQFIMYVGDHGGLNFTDNAPDCSPTGCKSSTFHIGPKAFAQMMAKPDHNPTITCFSAGPVQPAPVTIITNLITIPNVPFSYPIDLNNDGDLNDPDEGWEACAVLDKSQVSLEMNITVVGAPTLVLKEITLESGDIAKDLRYSVPTLSTWGLVVLALLLMTAATILIGRMRPVDNRRTRTA